MLDKFFNPKSVAVIGASRDETSVGHAIFKNALKSKARVYPVNPNAKQILGVKCYPNVKDIKNEVDLAVIVVPAAITPQILIDCAEKKVENAVIISAGFSETGNKSLEAEIKRLSDELGIRVIGPNCLGVLNAKNNFSFFTGQFKDGEIVLISQSGALGVGMLDWIIDKGIGLRSFVSVGNMTDVEFSDLVEYFSKDKKTKVIALYIESFKNARRFLKACSKSNKTIIALKSGSTSKGGKAASTHTGALATDDNIVSGAFKQYGVLRVGEIEDLMYCSLASAWMPKPAGNKVVVVTNAGGLGVISADDIEEQDLKTAEVPVKELSKFLPKNWSHSNPVDLVGDARADRYEKVFRSLDKKSFDALLIILTPQSMTEPLKTARSIVDFSRKIGKPVYTCFFGGEKVEKANEYLLKNNIPVFEEPGEAVETLKLLLES